MLSKALHAELPGRVFPLLLPYLKPLGSEERQETHRPKSHSLTVYESVASVPMDGKRQMSQLRRGESIHHSLSYLVLWRTSSRLDDACTHG